MLGRSWPHAAALRAREAGFLAPILALTMGLGACASTPASGPLLRGGLHDIAGTEKARVLRRAFVRQQTPASCSVASVTTVVNAALRYAGKQPVSQEAIQASDTSGTWARATRDDAAPGVTLDALGLHTLQALYAHGLRRVAVDVVHVTEANLGARESLEIVLKKYARKSDDYFIIANFQQSAYTPKGAHGGHMSVIGAYNERTQQTLVLDVDAEVGDPYWVSFDALVQGMHTADDETGEPRGYLVIRKP